MRLKAYSDSEGNRTAYTYSLDGLPLSRTNALGHRFEYEYDRARRLTTLRNENQAEYHFAYDPMNRFLQRSQYWYLEAAKQGDKDAMEKTQK